MKAIKRVVKLLTNNEAFALMKKCKYEDKSEEMVFKELQDMGLTKFEIYNVINIRPTSYVCLQTIVEEIDDRLNEEQINRIISFFNK